MSIRSGAQYIQSMGELDADIWLNGQRIADVTTEPVFRGPIREIARLYDMQFDPTVQDQITHVSPETGKRVSNAFLVPRSYDDLMAHRRLFETWAEATFGLMGRSPDFLNITLTSMCANENYLRQFSQEGADNLINYYRHVRVRLRAMHYQLYPKDELCGRVDRVLAEAKSLSKEEVGHMRDFLPSRT